MPLKEFCYLQSPGEGDMPHHAGPWESTRFGQVTEGVCESVAQSLDCIFQEEGKQSRATA